MQGTCEAGFLSARLTFGCAILGTAETQTLGIVVVTVYKSSLPKYGKYIELAPKDKELMARGRSIRIFLTDGSPNGIKIVDVSNWTGQAIQCPRQQLPSVKKRPEVAQTGVYILSGPDPDSPGDSIVYVGEGDTVWTRINDHNRTKDFWEQFIVFISKDENLTKAHVRYLEARMIQDIVENKRVKLENGTQPPLPHLPEADREDMEVYLDYVKMLLPTLGINILEPVIVDSKTVSDEQRTYFYIKARGATATGYDTENGFLVAADSTAVVKNTKSLANWSHQLKDKLAKSGVLIEQSSELYKFSTGYTFSSTSSAADVISGQSMSGPQSWKTNDGKTYKAFTQDLIDQVPIPDEEK